MSGNQRASGSHQSIDKSGAKGTPRGAETQMFGEALNALGSLAGRTPRTAGPSNAVDNSLISVHTPSRPKRKAALPVASQQFSISGIPVDEGYGMSVIGGQNEWARSQEPEEESLPPARYNLSPVQPALSPTDDVIPGLSEVESMSMAAPDSPIIDRRRRAESRQIESPEQSAQARLSRGRGRGRTPQPALSHQIPRHLTLPPLNIGTTTPTRATNRRGTHHRGRQPVVENRGRTSGPALIKGLLPDQALPETPQRSQDGDNSSRASRRAGSYDPEDNKVSWDHRPRPGEDPNRDRSRELTGPTYTPKRGVKRPRRSSSSESEDGSRSFSVEEMLRSGSELPRGGSTALFSGVSEVDGRRYGGYVDSGEDVDVPLGQERRRAKVLVSNSSSGNTTGLEEGVGRGSAMPISSNSAVRNLTSAETSGSKKLTKSHNRVLARGGPLPDHGSWSSHGTGEDNSFNSRTFPPNQEALRRARGEVSSSTSGREYAFGEISPEKLSFMERLGYSRESGDGDELEFHREPTVQSTGLPERQGGISANGSGGTSLDSVFKSQLYGMAFAQAAADEEERARAEGRVPPIRMPPGYQSDEDLAERTPKASGKVVSKGYTPAKPYVPPPFFTRDTPNLHGFLVEEDPENSYVAGASGIDRASLVQGSSSPRRKSVELSSQPEEQPLAFDEDEIIPETQPSGGGEYRAYSPVPQVLVEATQPSQEPRVLVPATASYISDILERSSPAEYVHHSVKYPFEPDTQGDQWDSPSRLPSFVAPSVPDDEPLGFSGLDAVDRHDESPEIPLLSRRPVEPVESFEFPAPAVPEPSRGEESRKRKRSDRDEGLEEAVSPKKKSRRLSPVPQRTRRKSPGVTPTRPVEDIFPPIVQPLLSTSSAVEASAQPQTPVNNTGMFSSSPLSSPEKGGGSDEEVASPSPPLVSRRGGKSRGRVRGGGAARANLDNLASQDPFKILAQGSQDQAAGNSLDTNTPSTQARNSRKRTAREADLEDANVDQDVIETLPPRSSHSKRGGAHLGRSEPTKSKSKPKTQAKSGSVSHRTRAQTAVPTSQSTDAGASATARRVGYVFVLHGKYYVPAKVVDSWEGTSQGGDSIAVVCSLQLEDGSTVEAPLDGLYRCEIKERDELCIPGKKGGRFGRKGAVVDVQSWEGSGLVTVHPELTPKKGIGIFASKDIGVTADTVWREWDDRRVNRIEDVNGESQEQHADESTRVQRKSRPTASLDEYPTQSTGASRRSKGLPLASQSTSTSRPRKRIRLLPPTDSSTSRKPLSGCAFIISLSITDEAGNRISEKSRNATKAELQKSIQQLGGRVIEDDFAGLVRYGGSFSDDGNRWIWNEGDLEFVDSTPTAKKKGKGKAKEMLPEPVFLIADRANRTVKYMTALATGVPCIHKSWIDSGAILDWLTYLLPAGDCHLLDLQCSQSVRQDWKQRPISFQDAIEKSDGIRKSLQEKSIIFVYPSRKGSSINEDEFENQYVFPCLSALMGATRVEIIHDLKNASLGLKKYDAIVFENNQLPTRTPAGSESVLTVESNWVSDCAISGTFINYRETS